MSIDYEFNLATAMHFQEVFVIFLKELGLSTDVNRTEWGHPDEILGPGFIVRASAINPCPEAELGGRLRMAEPMVRFSFSPLGPRLADYEQAMSIIFQGVMAVLHQVPGDAVFLFNWEKALLLRREGQILLDTAYATWTPERLLLLGDMPHSFEVLPVL